MHPNLPDIRRTRRSGLEGFESAEWVVARGGIGPPTRGFSVAGTVVLAARKLNTGQTLWVSGAGRRGPPNPYRTVRTDAQQVDPTPKAFNELLAPRPNCGQPVPPHGCLGILEVPGHGRLQSFRRQLRLVPEAPAFLGYGSAAVNHKDPSPDAARN